MSARVGLGRILSVLPLGWSLALPLVGEDKSNPKGSSRSHSARSSGSTRPAPALSLSALSP
jgi:hypothetical protein